MNTSINLHCINEYLSPDGCLQTPSINTTLGCSCVELKETKNALNNGTLEKLRLKYVEENIVVYAIDEALETPYPYRRKPFKHPKVFSNILKTVPGIHSPCDYLIFFLVNDKLNVIQCELKSKTVGECISKFKATKCFIEYVKLIISNFEETCPVYCGNTFKYLKVLVHLSNEMTARTLNKNGTYPSGQIDKGYIFSKKGDINIFAIGQDKIRNNAFELSWKHMLEDLRIMI